MRSLAVRIALLLIPAAALGACRTAPIRDRLDQPLFVNGPPSLERSAEAIWRAGRKLGWQVEPVAPGVERGTLRLRSHVAVVRIEHDETRFSVRYEASENLLASDGEIHDRYNAWVDNLVARIAQEPTWPDPIERPAPP